jgi:biopolymer transport protein ExbB/TolQ
MDAVLGGIVVALITTVGTIMVAVLNTLRKENREDHNIVRDKLQELREDVKHIDNKLDDHITWHLDQE